MSDFQEIEAAANEADFTFAVDVVIEAAEGESKSPMKFDVLAYTGGKLMVAGYDHPIIVDLKGMGSRNVIVANLDHNKQARVGHVTAKENDGSSLRLKGLLSADTPARTEVMASAAAGFPWQASIEVSPKSKPVLTPAGKSVEVNGQSHDGPVYVARKSTLNGFAFLGMGADDNTKVTIAAEAASQPKGSTMNPEFKAWLEVKGFVADDVNAAQSTYLKSQWEAEVKAAAAPDETEPPVDPPADPPIAAEQFNLAEILSAHAQHGDDIDAKFAQHEDDISDKKKLKEIRAAAVTARTKLKQDAIKLKWNQAKYDFEAMRAENKVELELVRAERPAGPAIHAKDGNEITTEILGAACLMSGGYGKPEEHYSEEILEKATKRFRKSVGIQEVLIEAAIANGYHGRTWKSSPSDVMRFAFKPIEAGGFSHVDVPGLLSNNANKFLLKGFSLVDEPWRKIAAVKPVNDYKQHTSYRMTGVNQFEKIGPTGEIKHGTLGEESYTNQADMFALMLGISEKDIVNDDLGVLTQAPQHLGNGAIRKLCDEFWKEFLNDATFFTAGNANYLTGAGSLSVLGIDALTTMEQKFFDFVDANGKPVGTSPRFLLTPTSLAASAATLMRSAEVRNTAANNKDPVSNPHQGKFEPIMSRYLGNAAYAGSSQTAWYLVADPSDLASIEVAFLYGNEMPMIETATAEFDTFGIQMRGKFSFGIKKQDPRGAVKSKGAA